MDEFTSFEIYLLDRIIHGEKDCCKNFCIHGNETDLCAALLPNGELDDSVCYRGMRALYETNRNGEVDG